MRQEVEAFLHQLATEKKFSANTVAAYKNDLLQMTEFLQQKGIKRWSDVERQLVLGYFTDLQGRGYATSTLARKTASAKTLFKFLEASGVIRSALIEDIRSPKVRRSVPHPLPDNVVRELIRQCERNPSPEAKRDSAMMELLCASGMRINEMMSLNVDDVNIDGDSVSFTIRGPRSRSTNVSLHLLPALKKYMEDYRSQLMHHKTEKALFLNRLGKRLTRQGFWQIVKTYAKQAQMDNEVTLRALRHTFTASTSKAKA